MTKLIPTIITCPLSLACVAVQAVPVSGQGTWETTLQGRDLDGDLNTFEAWYDTTLDITWLADANYAGTTMNWTAASSWAAGLDPYSSGITGWRLPDTDPVNGTAYLYSFTTDGSTDSGYNISAPGTIYAGSTGSEMAHMFYNTMGNLGYYDTSSNSNQPGWGLTNTGPFSNVQPYYYWSATEYAPNNNLAWRFSMGSGYQGTNNKPVSFHAWAVHSGDVGSAVVPVPGAIGLFGSGLIGLAGLVKRKAAKL